MHMYGNGFNQDFAVATRKAQGALIRPKLPSDSNADESEAGTNLNLIS